MRIEGGERLVHEQHLRLIGKHARNLDALFHAAGQLGGMFVILALQPDEIEVAMCTFETLLSWQPACMPNSTLPNAVSHG
jgi:hypothetical protein